MHASPFTTFFPEDAQGESTQAPGQPIPGEGRLPPVATDTEAAPERLLTQAHVNLGPERGLPRQALWWWNLPTQTRGLAPPGASCLPPGGVILPTQIDSQGKRLLQNQHTGAWPGSPEQFLK